MAYFYGEEYWDAMLKESVIQGKSTGPEWHNDDVATMKLKERQVQVMEKKAENSEW